MKGVGGSDKEIAMSGSWSPTTAGLTASYRLWDLVAKKRIVSCNVVFDESSVTKKQNPRSLNWFKIVSKSEIALLKALLSTKFEMKDLGAAKKILGMEIFRDRQSKKLWITQKKYIHKVLEKFSMLEAKQVSILLPTHFKLSIKLSPNTQNEVELRSTVSYANIVGCLMYAMICRRPDISQAVSVVSSNKTEYMAVIEASKEALWLKDLVEKLGFKHRGYLFAMRQSKRNSLGKEGSIPCKDQTH
ncbi:hypothetical protein RJ639_003746 [Escallonia herrerae]|uniref:Reverse transcriptase Ty1/copia-type domain-containing protein n=1 Tax=Escallonia herrerae TaxID=1293975 RepID=A0AA89B1R8_9ASTE|nr:hypothetical protein RJ639_003746 [Escallonia herrerae]